MELFTDKSITKKIIILIVMILLFNFTMPNYVHADHGGKLFNPISQLLLAIADEIIDALEEYFVGWNGGYDEALYGRVDDTIKYAVKYSPGIIFSNKVPVLSIDFISNKAKEPGEINYNLEWRGYDVLWEYYECINIDNNGFDIKSKYSEEIVNSIKWSDCQFKSGSIPSKNILDVSGIWYFTLLVPELDQPMETPDGTEVNQFQITISIIDAVSLWETGGEWHGIDSGALVWSPSNNAAKIRSYTYRQHRVVECGDVFRK